MAKRLSVLSREELDLVTASRGLSAWRLVKTHAGKSNTPTAPARGMVTKSFYGDSPKMMSINAPEAKVGSDLAPCEFVATPVDDLPLMWKLSRPDQLGVELSLIQTRAIIFGAQPWIFSLLAEGRCVGACVASLERGRLSSSLKLTLTGDLPDREAFWNGVMAFVARHDITHLWVESIGFPVPAMPIPPLGSEKVRFSDVRLYGIDLDREDHFSAFSHGTKSMVKKARKSGVKIVDLPRAEAAAKHCSLIKASLERRAQRGEIIKDSHDEDYVNALLAMDAGRLYQAVVDGEVVSSKLIFFMGNAAFWDSSGSSPLGMKLGASHLLMLEIIQQLKAQGLHLLNMDVVSEGAGGLGGYKAGFGAMIWRIERADFDCSSIYKMIRNGARRLWRLARTERALVKRIA